MERGLLGRARGALQGCRLRLLHCFRLPFSRHSALTACKHLLVGRRTASLEHPFHGISRKPNGKWQSGLTLNGKRVYPDPSTFGTPEEAAIAFDALCVAVGESSRRNVLQLPVEWYPRWLRADGPPCPELEQQLQQQQQEVGDEEAPCMTQQQQPEPADDEQDQEEADYQRAVQASMQVRRGEGWARMGRTDRGGGGTLAASRHAADFCSTFPETPRGGHRSYIPDDGFLVSCLLLLMPWSFACVRPLSPPPPPPPHTRTGHPGRQRRPLLGCGGHWAGQPHRCAQLSPA